MDTNKISEITKKRYSDRYKKLGKNIKTLGWGTEEQQNYRFEQTVFFLPQQPVVLDIGCGFGDYLLFLNKNEISYKKYIGWDINENFIDESVNIHKTNQKAIFDIFNISENSAIKTNADIGIMLGLLNWKFSTEQENYNYSKLMIENAFSYVNECLVVDFLSTKLAPEYPKEDFVFYHNPIKMLEFAFTLSPNVVLKHDYAPIPQKEFMLAIYK